MNPFGGEVYDGGIENNFKITRTVSPLAKPVSVVQQAVANLYKEGTETVEQSSDLLLKRDTPPALEMVQAASDSLGQAAQFIAADPYRKDFYFSHFFGSGLGC